MANICYYKIRAKGSRKALLIFANSLPRMEELEFEEEYGTDEEYTIVVCGDCKWSLNYGCEEDNGLSIDVGQVSMEDVENGFGFDFWGIPLRQKSELLDIEIQAHYWSGESEFDQFDHYIKGECVKRRKIAFDYEVFKTSYQDHSFDWDTLEFIGHEGEYDESVDGEESDNEFMDFILRALGGVPGVTVDGVAPGGIQSEENTGEDEESIGAMLSELEKLFASIEDTDEE